MLFLFLPCSCLVLCFWVNGAVTDSYEDARELRRLLKLDWVELWDTKYEDEVQAEGISVKDFEALYVDRGEVIHATRDVKPLSFHEILEKHVGEEEAKRVDVDPRQGGWRKFSRTHFPARRVKREEPRVKFDAGQQQRKAGSGWLNKARIWKKKRLADRY